ncbi:MAG: PEP-CTERM sorting domain-containing protein [Planctomycetota bacterium]|jgi:hypothetical protein|nr:hypothetical protein [Planctomycetota bacterium]MDP6369063.1 PEP-CTERM sorting domain-containing protein [Planctomycetota bacterium]MDP6519165.1 PEP-CTERM sorting domain-containing protein [Planctomycetota bacterium]MDP6839685.1 PEP-CTERM sorting domain-containing protein [Planctomycetota bacterium]MDP6954876.1 PEP-CTERM sorting domain-containing protein [Planctomycetota bacterium]
MNLSSILATVILSLALGATTLAQSNPGQRPSENAKGGSPMTPEPITIVLLAGTLGGGAYLARRRKGDE